MNTHGLFLRHRPFSTPLILFNPAPFYCLLSCWSSVEAKSAGPWGQGGSVIEEAEIGGGVPGLLRRTVEDIGGFFFFNFYRCTVGTHWKQCHTGFLNKQTRSLKPHLHPVLLYLVDPIWVDHIQQQNTKFSFCAIVGLNSKVCPDNSAILSI